MDEHAINVQLVNALEKDMWEEAAKRRAEMNKQRELEASKGITPDPSTIKKCYAKNESPYNKDKPTHGQKIGTNPHFIIVGTPEDVQQYNPIQADGAWRFEYANSLSSKLGSPWKTMYSPGGVLGDYMPTLDQYGSKIMPNAQTVLETSVMLQYTNNFPFYLGVFLINMPVDKKIDCPMFNDNIQSIIGAYASSHRETKDTISLAGIMPPNSSSGSIDLLFKAKTQINESGGLILNGSSMEEKRNWIHITIDGLEESVISWDFKKGMIIESSERPEGSLKNKVALVLAGSELHKLILSNYPLIAGTNQALTQNSWQMDVKYLLSPDTARRLKLQDKNLVHVIPITSTIVERALDIARDHIAKLPFAYPNTYQICLFRLDSLQWDYAYAPIMSSGATYTASIEYECKFRIIAGHGVH